MENVPGPVFADDDPIPHRNGSRIPWALILAFAILLGFEAWLHVAHWPKKIPYALDVDEYYAVSAAMDKYPVPDVLIIGSSRARECIDCPQMSKILSDQYGKPLRVANYSVSGGRTYVMEAMVRRLLRQRRLPKLIILGGAERDIGFDSSMHDQAALYWNLSDWLTELHRRRTAVLEDLPTVARNYLGRVFLTLRYREQLRLHLEQWAAGEPDPPTMVEGGLSIWQNGGPNKSIEKAPPSPRAITEYVRKLQDSTYPNNELLNCFKRIALVCQNRNVHLIAFQVPVPKVLMDAMPANVPTAYAAAMRKASKDYGATWLDNTQVNPDLGNAYFRDGSHLNLRGADLITADLVHAISTLRIKW